MSAAASAIQVGDTLAGLADANGPSLVRIDSGCRSAATGVVWSKDGLIVTASHLIGDDGPRVHLGDGRSFDATIVGRDPGTDLALLRVDAKDLVPPKWEPLDAAKVGHLTLSLGRPGKTVRAALGMIGVLGDSFRTWSGGNVDRYLQVDGGVPDGFVGGLLVDVKGNALGLHTPALMRGVSLTLPTATIRRVVDELLAHGKVRRGYLGVGVSPVRFPPQTATQHGQRGGAIVVSLEPGGPSEKGGLVLGDVILQIDGTEIDGPRSLSAFLVDRIDVDVTVKVVRAGNTIDVKVKTGQRP